MATKLSPVLVADFNTSLAGKIATSGTTGTLQTNLDDDGTTMPNGLAYFTIDGGNSAKEHIQATKTGTALTNIKSVSRQGTLTTGVVREHRTGATIVITDFAHIKMMNDILIGSTDLNASVPLKYDAVADMTGDTNKLATVKYINDIAIAGSPDASTTTKGIAKLSIAPVSPTNPIAVGDNDTRVLTTDEKATIFDTYTYGETIDYVGLALYLKASDGKVYKCNADFSDERINNFIGFSKETGVLNDVKKVQIAGKVAVYEGLTVGSMYYISGMVAGTITTAEPANSKVVGLALSPTTLLIRKELTTNAQRIVGVKTFNSIPVLPASNPTTDNQAVRKAYVDTLTAKTGTGTLGVTSPVVVTHNLGRIPQIITLSAFNAEGLAATEHMHSDGIYADGVQNCVFVYQESGGYWYPGATAAIGRIAAYPKYTVISIGDITSTTFTLTPSCPVDGGYGCAFLWSVN